MDNNKIVTYTDYLEAAEKHLFACEKLCEVLKHSYSENLSDDLKKKEKSRLIAEIYYLSGYIFECTIVYGMLRYIKYTENIYNLKANEKTHQISFYKDDALKPTYVIQGHNIQQNIQFFKRGNKFSDTTNIPFVGKLEPNLYPMYRDWLPEVRYKIDNDYKTEIILEFVKVSKIFMQEIVKLQRKTTK